MVPPERQLHNIYEINTAVYLDRLSHTFGHPITLGSIPDSELTRIASYGIDTVWLMGIWQRSKMAVSISLKDQGLMQEVRGVLPDFTEQDMVGSAYAISAYEVNERFGGEAELATFRQRLRDHGMKLLLDFVPNHTALDHQWLQVHPEYYMHGTFWQQFFHPSHFYKSSGNIIAKGRDPHFAPWPDVAQLHALSIGYRQESVGTLKHIASMCDGVRCDMAMLMTNRIFADTWSIPPQHVPEHEYWTYVTEEVHASNPDFSFIAECYWDMQKELIQQGFDYCYDKDLYDRLVANDMAGAQAHTAQISDHAERMVYFLENHDEPRIAAVLDQATHETALRFLTQQPGVKLWHDGEFEGNRIKLPVHIGRGPIEQSDEAIVTMYRTYLTRQ